MNSHTQKDWLDRTRSVVSETEKETLNLLKDDKCSKPGTSYQVLYNINQKAHSILMTIKTYF